MSLFNRKRNELTPTEVYAACCKEQHETAARGGYAKRGIIFIPELASLGEKVVLTFLRDNAFQAAFQDAPEEYYYAINVQSFMAGVVFADMWHHDYEKLKSGYDSEVLSNGVANYASPILEKIVNISSEMLSFLYDAIFENWTTLHEPYWKLADPREYTFVLTLASYQLGVSMVLEKYGF